MQIHEEYIFIGLLFLGLKQIGLPRLEPFSVPLLELNLGAGNVSADVVFRDVEITGLTLTDVLTIK